MDERHGCGEKSPRDHDDGDPASRAEAQQDEVSGDFEEGVADEEESGTGSIDSTGKSQVAAHGERGKAEVDAVEIGTDVKQEKKRDEPPEDPAHDPRWVDFGKARRHLMRLRHARFDTTGADGQWESYRLQAPSRPLRPNLDGKGTDLAAYLQ